MARKSMFKNPMVWAIVGFGVYYMWKQKQALSAPVAPALPAPVTTLQPPPGMSTTPAGVAGLNW